MSHQRWRKPTAAVLAASELALIGESLDIPGGEALAAVKRVARHIDLGADDVHFLETLVALTEPQDWAAGARPVVWPSNEQLMELNGINRSALNRHVTCLLEAGLIAFKDSSNGKRWGQRDKDGAIVEAYGFDLSPLAARTSELEWLSEAIANEVALGHGPDVKLAGLNKKLLAIVDTVTCDAPSYAFLAIRSRFQSVAAALPLQDLPGDKLRGMVQSFLGFWSAVPETDGTVDLAKSPPDAPTGREHDVVIEDYQTAPQPDFLSLHAAPQPELLSVNVAPQPDLPASAADRQEPCIKGTTLQTRYSSVRKNADKNRAAPHLLNPDASGVARKKPRTAGNASVLTSSGFQHAETVDPAGNHGGTARQCASTVRHKVAQHPSGQNATARHSLQQHLDGAPILGANLSPITIPPSAFSLGSYCVSITGTPGNFRFTGTVHPHDSRNASGIDKSADMDARTPLSRGRWSN